MGKYSFDCLSDLPETTQPVNGRDNFQLHVNFSAISTVWHDYVMLKEWHIRILQCRDLGESYTMNMSVLVRREQ